MSRYDTNDVRRENIRKALTKVKPTDKWTLDDLARVWGVAKQRFITKRKDIEMVQPFPAPEKAPTGNSYLYPARACLEAMLAYEMRAQTAKKDKATRIQRLVQGSKAKAVDEGYGLPLQDLIRANTLQQDLEHREIQQRNLIPRGDVERVTGIIFAHVSTFISDIASTIDPNGELPADHRARLDDRGREALLMLHLQIKGLLSGDGDDGSTARNRRKARRPRRPGASR